MASSDAGPIMSEPTGLEWLYGKAAGPIQAATIVHTDTAGLQTWETRLGSRRVPAYIARPVSALRPPVMLVVCEAFGLNEHLRDVARRFAKEGYLAIAPDLMHGWGDPLAFDDFDTLRNDLLLKIPDQDVMASLDACVEWADREGGGNGQVCLTGFCWGGRWAWLYAAHRAIHSAVSFYGLLDSAGDKGVLPEDSPIMPRHPVDIASSLKTRVLGLYGRHDPAIPASMVDEMRKRLIEGSTSAKDSLIVVYPDAGHAFFADYRSSYNERDARHAWQLTLAFCRQASLNRPGAARSTGTSE